MQLAKEVAIVGAGPAGLAVAACLKKAGVDFVILEREQHVGSSWRRHYERLHLHTIKQFSSLPFLPFPANYPRYVPRHLMVEYLQAYAAHFGLQPRFGEAVCSVRREAEDWIVETNSLSVHSPFVVVAAGYNAEPVMPSVPGIGKFKGKAIHSADYPNAAPFAGQSVLVIGMGNTGAEIALDLAESGAHPTISLRNGVHIVPRDFFGIPIQLVAMLATKMLPLRANDALFPLILDLYLGNLKKFGIKRPSTGILQQIAKSSKIPVLDIGTARKIAQGAIKVMPGIAEITENGVTFNGGQSETFDAIIFATGYRAGYQNFLQADALPSSNGAADNQKGRNTRLYFVGYHNAVTGLLREISTEAVAVAGDIVRQKGERVHPH
jgi:cation diffusion facilitator CzcD-associated flavoprotein CzcO